MTDDEAETQKDARRSVLSSTDGVDWAVPPQPAADGVVGRAAYQARSGLGPSVKTDDVRRPRDMAAAAAAAAEEAARSKKARR